MNLEITTFKGIRIICLVPSCQNVYIFIDYVDQRDPSNSCPGALGTLGEYLWISFKESLPVTVL